MPDAEDKRYLKENVDALYNLAILVASQCKSCPRGTSSGLCKYCYSEQARFTLESMSEHSLTTEQPDSNDRQGSTKDLRRATEQNKTIVLEAISHFGSSGATAEMIDIETGIRNYQRTIYILKKLAQKGLVVVAVSDRKVFFPASTPYDYAMDQAQSFKRKERNPQNAPDLES